MWSVFSLTTDLCQQQHVISCWVVNVYDTWECLEHTACVTESLVVLPCWKQSLIWHTKVKAKSDWSVKNYIQADHNTIMPVRRQGNVKVYSVVKAWTWRDKNLWDLDLRYSDSIWLLAWSNHAVETILLRNSAKQKIKMKRLSGLSRLLEAFPV